MNKKPIIITALVSVIVTFVATTAFYLSSLGRGTYAKMASVTNDSPASRLMLVESLIDENYMGSYNKNRMTDMAIHSYVAGVDDRYTEYLTATQYKQMTENLDGDYRGIGIVVLSKDEKIYVEEVMKGGPAEKAGIMAGDFIVSVNGTAYTSASLNTAIDVIKSADSGETIVVGIERDGEVMDVSVIIESIELEYISFKMLDNDIGYIKIDTFGNDVCDDFEAAIDSLEKQGMKSLVIDLRSNPGGVLDSVVAMTDLLIPEGVITTIKYKSDSEEVYTSDENWIEMPMCVLVNGESASASEIMAGALKDHGKATLVGQKTFGKGVVQGVYALGGGTGLRVTVARYYTPSGVCIDGTGIEPDVEVALPEGVVPADVSDSPDDDIQLAKAVEVLK